MGKNYNPLPSNAALKAEAVVLELLLYHPSKQQATEALNPKPYELQLESRLKPNITYPTTAYQPQ